MQFFKTLFKKNKKISSISKLETTQTDSHIELLKRRIEEVDEKIKLTTQAIFEAQLVRLRLFLYKDSNIFAGFRRKIVESKAASSSQWHINFLFALYNERRNLQIELDRKTGKKFFNRINIWIRSIILFSCIVITSLIIIMGIFTAIYLFPLVVLIILLALFIKGRNIQR